jgi:hypothetical protein
MAATKAPKKIVRKKQDLSLDRLLKANKPVKNVTDAVNIDPRADVTTPQAYKRVPTPVHLLGQVVETYTKYKSDTITGVVVAIFNEAEHKIPGKTFDPEKLIGTKSHGVEWFAHVWLSPQRSHVASIRKVREIGRDATHLVADDFLRQALADNAVIARVDNYAHNQSGVQSYPTRVANLHVSPVASHYDAIIDKYRDKHPLVLDAPFVPWQEYVDGQHTLTGDKTLGAIVTTPRPSTSSKPVSKTSAPVKKLRKIKRDISLNGKVNAEALTVEQFVESTREVCQQRIAASLVQEEVEGAIVWFIPLPDPDVDGILCIPFARRSQVDGIWVAVVDDDGLPVTVLWEGSVTQDTVSAIDKYVFTESKKSN